MKNLKQRTTSAAIMAALLWNTMPAYAATITIPGNRFRSLGDPPTQNEFINFFTTFKTLAAAVMGICTITSLICFIISVSKLSTSAGNDMMRSKALKQILWSGIALAAFGGSATLVGIFWNIL